MRHRLFAATTLALGLACRSSTSPVPSVPDLNGNWVHLPGPLGVQLNLTWTADSVTGGGTYEVFSKNMDSNTVGCGGASLGATGNGTVVLRAARMGDSIRGGMFFDKGWSPPFSGALTGVTLVAQFMSVDQGPCPFDLLHGALPTAIVTRDAP